MKTIADIYDPMIRCRTTSIISREHEEDISYLDPLFTEIPILQAFIEDDDLMEMTVVSTCIGFVKTFTKHFKKPQ